MLFVAWCRSTRLFCLHEADAIHQSALNLSAGSQLNGDLFKAGEEEDDDEEQINAAAVESGT